MLKQIKAILGIAALATLCAGLAACKKPNDIELKEQEGYFVSVTYDSNGGKFLNSDNVDIVNMYKPDEMQANADGTVTIKLTDPNSEKVGNATAGGVPLSKDQFSFEGWYKNCELYLNENNQPVDYDGRPLVELEEGGFCVLGTEDKQEKEFASPRYVYSDPWDFSKDVITYSGEPVKLTLYAAWVPEYRFKYFTKNAEGEWEQYATTYFDYKVANNGKEENVGMDTLWLPRWENGAMAYDYKYSENDPYTFPKIEDTTFVAAYTDEAMQNKIDGSLKHHGEAIDHEHALAVNRDHNIYVQTERGIRYRIETAAQLADFNNVNPNGIYTILDDLDFTPTDSSGKQIYQWPASFANGTFTGVMASEEGKTVTIKGAKFNVASDTEYGGLFGRIGDGAKISGISFTDAEISFSKGNRLGFNFALFCGDISEEAEISDVTVSGLMKIGWEIPVPAVYRLNVLANGNTDGLTAGVIRLQVWGTKFEDYCSYSISVDGTKVDGNGNITIEAVYGEDRRKEKEFYDINFNLEAKQ